MVSAAHQRANKWGRRADIARVVLLVAIFVGVAFAVLRILIIGSTLLDIATSNHSINQNTNQNTQVLIDCTTPGHPCFERSRKSTGQAISSINQVTIIAVACARVPANDTLDKIQTCVRNNLNAVGGH